MTISRDLTGTPPSAPGPADLHSHVLPGVDDGARDLDEALEMLRIAAADGTRIIAATPHAARCELAQIIEGVGRLNEVATGEELDITIVTGCEVRLNPEEVDRFHNGELATLNGTRYLLVELPFRGEWPPYVDRAVYDLQVADAWPILAHAERYPAVQQDPLILADLIAKGVLIQVNANSLLGELGDTVRDTAEDLLHGRLAHLIASDSHRPQRRPPLLRGAIEHAAAVTSADYAAWMVETSVAVVNGDPITLPEPDLNLPRRARWLGRRWRRLSRD
jgi:protein-tyrosine phosphatase